MVSLESPRQHEFGRVLSFNVEDKQYTTDRQYLTGVQIKQLANLAEDSELFMTISEPWKDDPIADDEEVNLARPGIEGFYIKKKLKFSVNGVQHDTDRQYLTGLDIKRIGSIPSDELLYLFVEGAFEDELIEDGTRVNLARPGNEKFISKRKLVLTLIVNAQAKSWFEPIISFEQVIVLGFGTMPDETMRAYTVAYTNGPKSKPKGVMSKGDTVVVQNEMKFDVTPTDKS